MSYYVFRIDCKGPSDQIGTNMLIWAWFGPFWPPKTPRSEAYFEKTNAIVSKIFILSTLNIYYSFRLSAVVLNVLWEKIFIKLILCTNVLCTLKISQKKIPVIRTMGNPILGYFPNDVTKPSGSKMWKFQLFQYRSYYIPFFSIFNGEQLFILRKLMKISR